MTTTGIDARGVGPRAVLLTGATGSLGGELALALLTHTRATVYCLVRAADQSHATDRLRTRMLPLTGHPYPAHRLIAVRGNLLAPDLGLTDRDHTELSTVIDTVHHCGASVHLTGPYRKLAPANVGGTRSLITFARHIARSSGQRVHFIHISTLATIVPTPIPSALRLDEATPPCHQVLPDLGYPRSKAEAEEAARDAHGNGLETTVMRPGVIYGHSGTGRTSDADLLVPLLRAAVALGTMPTGAGAVPADAVDTVARAIVELSRYPTAPGHTFHLVRRTQLPLTDVFAALPRAGYHLRTLPVEQWWQSVQEHLDDPQVAPLAGLGDMAAYLLAAGPRYQHPPVHSDATWTALAHCGMPEQPLDPNTFDRLVDWLINDGALPPPSPTRAPIPARHRMEAPASAGRPDTTPAVGTPAPASGPGSATRAASNQQQLR
ncbi:SDR family oxidoreductase [Streptomyces sp. cmx-4-9]|uniref:SDR family oxidoreductase n=1 Tax=Streptomyces sp. cmx-4-9 TaxID=2790941 RepID=UPI00397F6594